MANIDNVQLPDGSSYNIVDNTSGFATQNYVDSAVDSITKTTIGLGNVDNTSDLNKPISTATQAALNTLDEDKADKTDIATVESGTTASRPYSVGELVYVSGTLYRVKTAIASGATFTVGTNVEVTNVSNTLTEQIGNVKNLIGNGLQRITLTPGDASKFVDGTVAGYASFLVAFFQQNAGSGMYAINVNSGNITMTHIVGLDNTQSTLFHNEYDTTNGLRFRLSSARLYDTTIFIFGIGV